MKYPCDLRKLGLPEYLAVGASLADQPQAVTSAFWIVFAA